MSTSTQFHDELPRRHAAPGARGHYLAQRHGRATLADHRALHYELKRVESPLGAEIVSFLGADCRDVVIKQIGFPLYELPNAQRALDSALSSWRLKAVVGPADCAYAPLWSPVYRRVEVRPGKHRNFLLDGGLLYELPDGSRRAAIIERSYQNSEFDVLLSLVGDRSASGRLSSELKAVRAGMRRRHYLKRQVIRGDGTLLRTGRPVGWDDLALASTVRETLERNLRLVFDRRSAFRAGGIPQRRGILLYGPPGNGKTMIGKVLAGMRRATFLWITPADFESRDYNLRDIFRLARRLKPSIVFLEDLDFYASERSTFACNGRLGELLAQMDGLERNDGLLVAATTNDIEAIEPALKDRPSRFDVRIEIGLPDAKARRQILGQQLGTLDCPAELIDAAASVSTELTGAQVRELAILMVQEAIFRGAIGADGRAQPGRDDLDASLARLTGRARKPLGFRAE